ncbi:MAG TPA: monovalent cation:proton antiporter family protein, partial [bacterium]|nr:monovalent cation:proton antiporter family protein [bacterium]
IKKIYEDLSNTSSQLRVRTAFALMVLFAFLSQSVGVELILGAFVAGMLFSLFFKSTSAESAAKFDAIGFGFLIPVFFIMVGAKLDLGEVIRNPGLIWTAFILLGVAFLIKIIPLLPFSFLFGVRNATAGGILLAGQLSLTIAFAEVAVAEKLLAPSMRVSAIIIAIGTCLIAPLLFGKIHKKRNSLSKKGIIILGAGKMGRLLAKRFQERQHNVCLMDTDINAVEKAKSDDLAVFHYEKLEKSAFIKAGVERSNVFVAVTNDDKINLNACIFVRDSFGIVELAARVGNPANTHLFIEQKIRPMNTTLASAVALENIIYRPNVFSVLSHEETGTEVIEVNVRNPLVAGKRLMDITIPGNGLILIIERNGVSSIPHGKTILEQNDTVTIFLNSETILEIARLFDPESNL